MFCYGFISHRNQIFPYQIIIYSKNTLLNIFSKTTKKDVEIKQRYKNWEDKNSNYYPQAIIKKYFPSITVCVAGESLSKYKYNIPIFGGYQKLIFNLIHKYELKDNIEFLGPLDA